MNNDYKLVDNENNKISLYTSFSVINALDNEKIRNYWSNNFSYFENLYNDIHMNDDRLKDDIILLMEKETIKINVRVYQNDMISFKSRDDVITLLVHFQVIYGMMKIVKKFLFLIMKFQMSLKPAQKLKIGQTYLKFFNAVRKFQKQL